MATTKIRSSSIEDGQVSNADLSATIAVTGGQIADDAVTLAKMADGTQGDTLYYGAAGAPTLLAKPGTPADEVLTFATGASDPAWVAAAVSKDNLPAFYVQFTGGDQTLVDAAITLIEWNTEIYDTASGYNITGTGDNPRSYTVQSGGAGKWFLTWGVYCYTGAGGTTRAVEGNIYKNGSVVQTVMHSMANTAGFNNLVCSGSVVLELVEDDYVTIYGLVDYHSGTAHIASHAGATWFAGFRLAE